MNELEISVAPMIRLCKKAGAKRVSEEAAKELARGYLFLLLLAEQARKAGHRTAYAAYFAFSNTAACASLFFACNTT